MVCFVDIKMSYASNSNINFTENWMPETGRKHETWDLLRTLHRKFSLPWLVAGDFNEILLSHEKLGGALRSESAMRDFREVVDDCGFMDLGYIGEKIYLARQTW